MKTNITAILTCYNRKEKTVRCLKSLTESNLNVNLSFIIVDDASSDGTTAAVENLGLNVKIINGTGNLYWCGGMRKGIEYFLSTHPDDNDYCLLINDDVDFFENSIIEMLSRQSNRPDVVVVGATCNSKGEFTYGLKCREKWYRKNITRRIAPSEEELIGETFNANCVLIRNAILKKAGNIDSVYTHSLGDYDFGFSLVRKGYKLISSSDFVGICENNQTRGTWTDKTLSIKERFKLKESPKGSPTIEWWHFLYKNFGLMTAIKHTIISYVKILFKI